MVIKISFDNSHKSNIINNNQLDPLKYLGKKRKKSFKIEPKANNNKDK